MRQSRMLFGTALVVLSVGVFEGCSQATYPGLNVATRDRTVVEVTNNHWSDVVIYAIRGGSRFRLGTVGSFSRKRLRVPPVALAAGADIRLQVDPIGSRTTYTTEAFSVRAGETVDWIINNHLPLSRLAIWR